jgi:hypothetical protein
MSRIKILGVAAVTMAAALGSGYTLQNFGGNQNGSPLVAERPAVSDESPVFSAGVIPDISGGFGSTAVVEDTIDDNALVLAPEFALTETIAPTGEVASAYSADGAIDEAFTRFAAITADDLSLQPDALLESFNSLAAAGDECGNVLSLQIGPAATIDLSLFAPCDQNAAIVVSHEGLVFSALTSETGQLELSIPAMTLNAEVEISFATGRTLREQVTVPDIDKYDRIAVQWQGENGLSLNAFHENAAFGGPGHVSADNPFDANMGGFLISLGDKAVPMPMMAEVFSAPSSQRDATHFSIEAPVTASSCDQVVTGETIAMQAGNPVAVFDLSLAMPDCGAIGEFVVLNNLLPEQTIASN